MELSPLYLLRPHQAQRLPTLWGRMKEAKELGGPPDLSAGLAQQVSWRGGASGERPFPARSSWVARPGPALCRPGSALVPH